MRRASEGLSFTFLSVHVLSKTERRAEKKSWGKQDWIKKTRLVAWILEYCSKCHSQKISSWCNDERVWAWALSTNISHVTFSRDPLAVAVETSTTHAYGVTCPVHSSAKPWHKNISFPQDLQLRSSQKTYFIELPPGTTRTGWSRGFDGLWALTTNGKFKSPCVKGRHFPNLLLLRRMRTWEGKTFLFRQFTVWNFRLQQP